MTNKEAINGLQSLVEVRRKYGDMQTMRDEMECLEMAIAAPKAEPCEDAVSREAVLDGVDRYIYKAQSAGTQDDFYSFAELVVKALPRVTPKLRTGKWIRHTRVENVYDIAGVKTWGIKHQCDQCTFTTIAIEGFGYYDYCPHCGAEMEGESE